MRIGMFLALGGIAAVCCLAPAVGAGEADAILDKLVEKGLLTASEAQEVRNEIGGQAKQRDDEQRALIKEAGAEIVPKWTQAITLAGDMRLRHETIWHWEHVNGQKANEPDRTRERLRMRVGLKAKVSPILEGGVRLATGSNLAPVSTNQTLMDEFDKKDVFVDQAYLKVSTVGQPAVTRVPFTVWAGKFDIPFTFTPLVWDPDVTLEGLAASLAPVAGPVELAITAGAFPVDELSAEQGDPALFAGQAGFVWSPAAHGWRPSLKNLRVKAAAAYYDFTNLKAGLKTAKSARFGNTARQNSTADMTFFRRDFDELDVNGEIASIVLDRPARLFGDYVRNTSEGGDDTGYIGGLRWGRTDTPGAFEVGYFYQHLENDAVIGQFTDSDFGDGGTGAEGHVASIAIGTLKNSVLGLKYNSTRLIDDKDRHASLYQIDWVTKF